MARGDKAAQTSAPHLHLLNDAYFQPRTPDSATHRNWALFPRLPAELRLHVWLLSLRQHRMIELFLRSAEVKDEARTASVAGDPPQYYATSNSMGRVVSGRHYKYALNGRGYPTSLNPLLWVNSEARRAALSFYRIHLPYDENRVLYLNPEYDVLFVHPGIFHKAVVADFLHDVRAYDPKDEGVAHLAMHSLDLQRSQLVAPNAEAVDVHINPFAIGYLHPTASKSFSEILRHKLRSVLCVVHTRARVLGEAGLGPATPGSTFHVSQTLPLIKRGIAATAVRWLDSDPRRDSAEAQADLRRVPLQPGMRFCATSWTAMERRFGVGERAKDDPFRFYICLTHDWRRLTECARMERGTFRMGPEYPPEPEWERPTLAEYIREEEEEWRSACKLPSSGDAATGAGLPAQAPPSPQQGLVADAVLSTIPPERGEAAIPSPAVGMWLFPPEAIEEAEDASVWRSWMPQPEFDLSAARPGLMLFEVM